MSKELANEIDEFLAETLREEEPVEEPTTDDGEEQDEQVETEQVEDDTTEEPASDEPVVEETPVAEEPAVEEVSELEELKRQNELLQQRLNEAYEGKKTEPEQAKPDEKLDENFFGEWKFDDIVESQESLQKFLGEFAGKVVTLAKERTLRELPSTVSKLTTQQIEARQTVDKFYGEHPQLSKVKPYVAQVVSTVASEHADWDLPQVLDEAAKRTYEALGLKRIVEKNEKKNPAFAGTKRAGTRGAVNEPAKSRLEKELEELMDL